MLINSNLGCSTNYLCPCSYYRCSLANSFELGIAR
jgi:hypothetical protein